MQLIPITQSNDLWLTRWHIDQRFRLLPNYFGIFLLDTAYNKTSFHGILWIGLLHMLFPIFGKFSWNHFANLLLIFNAIPHHYAELAYLCEVIENFIFKVSEKS